MILKAGKLLKTTVTPTSPMTWCNHTKDAIINYVKHDITCAVKTKYLLCNINQLPCKITSFLGRTAKRVIYFQTKRRNTNLIKRTLRKKHWRASDRVRNTAKKIVQIQYYCQIPQKFSIHLRWILIDYTDSNNI